MKAPWSVALWAVLFLLPGRGEVAASPPPGTGVVSVEIVPAGSAVPRRAEIWDTRGTLYLAAGDAALLLDAETFWRPDLGRLTLVLGGSSMSVMDGSDVAVIEGGRLVHMPGPAFLWDGEMRLPVPLLVDDEGEARPWVGVPVRLDGAARRFQVGDMKGNVREASIEEGGGGWTLHLGANRAIQVQLDRRERASFVVRIPGLTYDPILHPLPSAHEVFRGLVLRETEGGLEITFSPPRSVLGYAITQPTNDQVEIYLGLDERDLRLGRLRRFTSPEDLLPRVLRTVALDPGHGGDDPGGLLGARPEAEVTGILAQRAAARIRLELGLETILTRYQDEGPRPAERAGRANADGAQILISLHVHPGAHGVTAYVARIEDDEPAPSPALVSLGFRSAGLAQAPHLAASRLLAQALVESVADGLRTESNGVQSEALDELRSAAMPAVLLEIGGDALSGPGVDAMVEALVRGIGRYRDAGDSEW